MQQQQQGGLLQREVRQLMSQRQGRLTDLQQKVQTKQSLGIRSLEVNEGADATVAASHSAATGNLLRLQQG